MPSEMVRLKYDIDSFRFMICIILQLEVPLIQRRQFYKEARNISRKICRFYSRSETCVRLPQDPGNQRPCQQFQCHWRDVLDLSGLSSLSPHQILIGRQGEEFAEVIGADHLIEELHRPLEVSACEAGITDFATDGIHFFFQ